MGFEFYLNYHKTKKNKKYCIPDAWNNCNLAYIMRFDSLGMNLEFVNLGIQYSFYRSTTSSSKIIKFNGKKVITNGINFYFNKSVNNAFNLSSNPPDFVNFSPIYNAASIFFTNYFDYFTNNDSLYTITSVKGKSVNNSPSTTPHAPYLILNKFSKNDILNNKPIIYKTDTFLDLGSLYHRGHYEDNIQRFLFINPIDKKKKHLYCFQEFTNIKFNVSFLNDKPHLSNFSEILPISNHYQRTFSYLNNVIQESSFHRSYINTNSDGYFSLLYSTSYNQSQEKLGERSLLLFKQSEYYDSLELIKNISIPKSGNFDVFLNNSLEFVLSKTGRYLYYTTSNPDERRFLVEDSLESLGFTKDQIRFYFSPQGIIKRENTVYLHQVDLAEYLQSGNLNSHIIHTFKKPSKFFVLHLQPVAYDGNIYISVDEIDTSYNLLQKLDKDYNFIRELTINETNTGTRNIQLYKLTNIDSFGLDSTYLTKVADSLFFNLNYLQTEVFESETWSPFPFKVKSIDSLSCENPKPKAWLEARFPYDSLGWQLVGDNAPTDEIFKTDTFRYSVNEKTRLRCFVWWGGWENIAYGWMYPDTANIPEPELKRLVGNIYNLCKDSMVFVKVKKDSSATGFVWLDNGSRDSLRTFTDSGTYILKVDYGVCERFDTVLISLPFEGVNMEDKVLCMNEESVELILENLPIEAKIVWQDGSKERSLIVQDSGTYCAIITDSNGCSQQVCGRVQLHTWVRPVWAKNIDTTLCQGDTLFLLDTSAYFSKSGNYILKYGGSSACDADSAIIILKIKSHFDDPSCPVLNCEWYLPNAVSPNADGLNELWSPVSACAGTSYCLSVYNRWGTLIHDDCDSPFDAKGLPEDVYMYRATLRNPGRLGTEFRKGLITVVR
jgi:hypothetical protein